MAINFPSTAGQATDGSYTYTVAGITYSWDGSSWAAAGAGASATDRTLFSVTQNAVGTAALSYNNNTGVFSYTPPDLSSYLTAEADTLASVTGRGATTSSNLTLSGTLAVNNTISVADDVVANFGASSDGRISYTSSTNRFYVRVPGGSGDLILGAGPAVRITNENGLTDRAVFTSSGATITGALTAGGLTYPTTNGSSGDVLTSDGAGNVSWATPSGLQTRTTAQITTSAIVNGGIANLTITTPATYALLKITTSQAAWVTLYTSTVARSNDASRLETTDPVPGSGVLAEVITTTATDQLITPGTVCFNASGSNATYAKIVNKSGITQAITVTLTYVQLEG